MTKIILILYLYAIINRNKNIFLFLFRRSKLRGQREEDPAGGPGHLKIERGVFQQSAVMLPPPPLASESQSIFTPAGEKTLYPPTLSFC